MMSLIFIMLLFAFISSYIGKRRLSYVSFSVSITFSVYWFMHHATDVLPISL